MLRGKTPFVRWTIILVELLGSILCSFYLGARFGMIYQFQKTVYELPNAENARASFKSLFNLTLVQDSFDLGIAKRKALL